MMDPRKTISLSISLAPSVFFLLPWISLFELAELAKQNFSPRQVNPRMGYLFISTFVASYLLFYFNFFWKKYFLRSNGFRKIESLAWNFVLILLLSLVLSTILRTIFDLEYSKAFFLVFLFRNTGILIICLLVVNAFESTEKSKLNQIKLDELAHEKTHTELAVLKSQLDPHFLFNTLNSPFQDLSEMTLKRQLGLWECFQIVLGIHWKTEILYWLNSMRSWSF